MFSHLFLCVYEFFWVCKSHYFFTIMLLNWCLLGNKLTFLFLLILKLTSTPNSLIFIKLKTDQMVQHVNTVNSLQNDLWIYQNYNQSHPRSVLVDVDRLTWKFIWKDKWTKKKNRLVKTILIKDDWFGGIMPPEFRTYCKSKVNMNIWNW